MSQRDRLTLLYRLRDAGGELILASTLEHLFMRNHRRLVEELRAQGYEVRISQTPNGPAYSLEEE